MTEKRPSLARKQTRGSEAARKAELDQGCTVWVEGVAYTVRLGDLTSMDAANLRREVGMSFMGLMRALQADADIDLIAALVWLRRRMDGEQLLSYQTVAESIGYDADIDVTEPTAEDEDAGEA